jgi:hypothetical protein
MKALDRHGLSHKLRMQAPDPTAIGEESRPLGQQTRTTHVAEAHTVQSDVPRARSGPIFPPASPRSAAHTLEQRSQGASQ